MVDYNVMLVEGNRLMMEQLSNAIRNSEGFKLAARYHDTGEALGQGAVFHPNLILLDLDKNPLAVLDDFRRVFPNARIICMGENWNAETAGRSVQNGAQGYLVKPFTGEELRKALETFGKSGMETSSHVISFFSPKGKSGKTTLIANLALALANKTDEQVCIIDADLQFGDMAVFLNLEPRSTIVEAVRDVNFLSPLSLNGYFVPVTDNVHVLCGTKNPSLSDKIGIAAFEDVIKMARSLYRYILLDIPPGFCPMSISASELSDTTYIVAMINGAYELRHVHNALEIFKDWQDYEERVKVVLTRVSPCDLKTQKELEERLDYPVDTIIPNEYNVVSAAADNGSMAFDINPDSQLTKSINIMADHIIGRRRIQWGTP